MIKKFISILLITIFTFCSVTCCYCNEDDHVLIYDMGMLETDYFVHNLSLETLQSMRGHISVYELMNNNGEIELFSNGKKYAGEEKEEELFRLFCSNEDYEYELFLIL